MSFIKPLNKIDPNPLLYGQKTLWLKKLQENNFKVPQAVVVSYKFLLDQLCLSFPFLKESKLNTQELTQNLPKIQAQIAKINFTDNIWKELLYNTNKLGVSRFAIRASTNIRSLDQFFTTIQNERDERLDAVIKNYYLKLFSPEILNQGLVAGINPILSIQIQGMLYGTVAGSISRLNEQNIVLKYWKTSDKSSVNEYFLDTIGRVLNQVKPNTQNLDQLLYPNLIAVEEAQFLGAEFLRASIATKSNIQLKWIKVGQEFWIVDVF